MRKPIRQPSFATLTELDQIVAWLRCETYETVRQRVNNAQNNHPRDHRGPYARNREELRAGARAQFGYFRRPEPATRFIPVPVCSRRMPPYRIASEPLENTSGP